MLPISGNSFMIHNLIIIDYYLYPNNINELKQSNNYLNPNIIIVDVNKIEV